MECSTSDEEGIRQRERPLKPLVWPEDLRSYLDRFIDEE